MYKAFFNLKRNPFDLTPDPHCFVPTPRHNEALAALYYGVRRHKGFVVVTEKLAQERHCCFAACFAFWKTARISRTRTCSTAACRRLIFCNTLSPISGCRLREKTSANS
ncbi:MAG: hypothetical protein WDM87_05170 [Terracidiphilus sp.]